MPPLLLLLAVVTATPQPKPDSAAEARQIIQRGIEAQGGEKQLERLSRNWRAKARGKAGSLEITGESLTSGSKGRLTTTLHSLIPVNVTVVDNGDRVWRSIAGITSEVTGKDLEEMRDGQYRHRVRNLLPLLHEPGFELSVLPEITVSDQPAVGIRVQSKGHRDIDLYFDKSSGLVVKTESRILPPGKPPIVLEQILSNFRDFDGLKLPMKFTKYENKRLTSVEEFVDITFVDKFDDHEFDKP